MGRIYTASVAPASLSVASDIFEVLAPADAAVEILEWELWQITDLGDAAEEVLTIELVRGIGSVTSGSGGSTTTPQPVEDGEAAFGGTVETQNTTRMAAGSGSLEVADRLGWNIRAPRQHIYTPEQRPIISPSNRWTLSILAPADAITIGGRVVLREIGG